MKIQEAYREFLVELKADNPITFDETIDESTYTSFQETFTEHFLAIFTKDEKIFESKLDIFGVNLSEMWASRYWKYLQKCSVLTFLHGDITEKIKKVMPSLSSAFTEVTGKPSDDIESVLNDDQTPSKIGEIIEMIKNSSLLNVGLAFAETTDFSEIGSSFDPNNLTPEGIRENPVLRRVQEKFTNLLQSKLRSGELSQQGLAEEMQSFALKFQTLFGDLMTGGGRRSEVEPKVLLGNTPAARHARMIARMQRKLEENKNRKNSS
jgi:hypothetical protein